MIKLRGVSIPTRETFCSTDGREPQTIKQPYVNLYVKNTNHCQAKCSFCEYSNNEPQKKLNFYKLIHSIDLIQRSGLAINKISFTGGEPTLYAEELNALIRDIRRMNENVYIVINTNGYNLNSLDMDLINNIALSRHHYDDDKNREILHTPKTPHLEYLKTFKHKEKLHIRCNLIKGYIDTQEEVLKFLDVLSGVGVYDFGFVSLFQINDFCKENFVDYKSINLDNAPRTRVIRTQTRENVCTCKNYLHYTTKGEISRIYARFNEDLSNCDGTLVFDGQNLTVGFNGEKIL
jgi:molybdenum cofactor biosynthesis enzyme MoaA